MAQNVYSITNKCIIENSLVILWWTVEKSQKNQCLIMQVISLQDNWRVVNDFWCTLLAFECDRKGGEKIVQQHLLIFKLFPTSGTSCLGNVLGQW